MHAALLCLLFSVADGPTAQQLYRESRIAYEAGRFQEAAELLEHAFRIDPDPTLLYNLARARESNGEARRARIAYEQFLRLSPNAKDRGAIKKRVAILTEQERPTIDLRAPAPPPKVERTTNPVPWIVTGLGVASVAAGGFLGVFAGSRESAARGAPVHATALQLRSEAGRYATMANVAYITGGVIALGGLIWAIVDLLGQPSAAPLPPSTLLAERHP